MSAVSKDLSVRRKPRGRDKTLPCGDIPCMSKADFDSIMRMP